LAVKEFETSVPAFETAFLQHMQAWTLEGKPRQVARRRVPIEYVISSIKCCRIVKDMIWL
jgi:hypothetical protein